MAGTAAQIKQGLKIVRDMYNFLLQLRIKIKIMPEADFNYLLLGKTLDMEQKIYLIFFRYY